MTADNALHGAAFDERGRARACTIVLEPGVVSLHLDDGSTDVWPSHSLSAAPAGEHGDQVLLRPSGAPALVHALVVSDKESMLALSRRLPASVSRSIIGILRQGQVRRKRSLIGLLAAGAGVLALLIGGYLLITRWIIGVALEKVSPSMEVRLGDAVLSAQLSMFREETSGPAVDALRAIALRLQRALPPHTPYEFKVHLVRQDTVNAYALPGGQIVFFSGLLLKADGPDAVAGVMAHEMQHVLQRHALRRMLERLGWSALTAVLRPGSGRLAQVAAGGAGTLVGLSYGREQELEADREGIRLLQAAHVPTRGMVDFFDALSREESEGSGVLSLLSTHPSGQDRLKRLKELSGATSARSSSRPIVIDWVKVRASLRSSAFPPVTQPVLRSLGEGGSPALPVRLSP